MWLEPTARSRSLRRATPGQSSREERPVAVPRALKVAHTAFVAVLVPVYWRQYGPGNFPVVLRCRASHVGAGDLLESPRLASVPAVGVLVPETIWMIDFGAGVLAGRSPIGLASYMFDRRIPLFVRALSLFHLWLTPLLVRVVSRTGYDRRAFRDQTVMTWLVLLASWRVTRPEDNVNWVYSRREQIRSPAARAGFVLLLMIAMPLALYLPAHVLLKRL